MNILSLFDGISMGRIAVERANIKIDSYYASEIDKNAIEIALNNYKDTKQLGDVIGLNESILSKLPKIGLIIAGSPCTNLSRAGNGKGLKGDQSKLFFEFVRVLNWIKENNNPNVKFMLENVEMKKEWSSVMSEYVGIDFIAINSKLMSAQNRPRYYWTNIEGVTIPENKNIKLKDILDNELNKEYIDHQGIKVDIEISEDCRNLINVINGEVRISQATKQGYIVANDGDGINLSFPKSKTRRGRVIKQKSSTLDCSCDICVYNDGIIRKLTISELEKLQTLPVGYTECLESDTARKKAIGNGWTVDVVAYILSHLSA